MLLALGPFRWRSVAPWRAARVAAGVVVPLAIGWWSGHIDLGAFAALGAFPQEWPRSKESLAAG